jgi:hypothetical protein
LCVCYVCIVHITCMHCIACVYLFLRVSTCLYVCLVHTTCMYSIRIRIHARQLPRTSGDGVLLCLCDIYVSIICMYSMYTSRIHPYIPSVYVFNIYMCVFHIYVCVFHVYVTYSPIHPKRVQHISNTTHIQR